MGDDPATSVADRWAFAHEVPNLAFLGGSIFPTCGERAASEVGWDEGDAEWLAFGNGQRWVRRDSIAEIMLVDYIPEAPAYGDQIYG